MSDPCDCVKHTKRIEVLEDKVDTLLLFKEWAEPILKSVTIMQEHIQKTSNNVVWMRNIGAIAFVLIGIVFLSWILPSFTSVQSDQKKTIDAINKNHLTLTKTINDNNYDTLESIKNIEIKSQKMLNDFEKKMDKAIIKSSKINHKATVRKIKAAIKG